VHEFASQAEHPTGQQNVPERTYGETQAEHIVADEQAEHRELH
jgi:hypothetical protein